MQERLVSKSTTKAGHPKLERLAQIGQGQGIVKSEAMSRTRSAPTCAGCEEGRGYACVFPKHAETRDRTGDLQIFGLTLSQLSYRGSCCGKNDTNAGAGLCPRRQRKDGATDGDGQGRKQSPRAKGRAMADCVGGQGAHRRGGRGASAERAKDNATGNERVARRGCLARDLDPSYSRLRAHFKHPWSSGYDVSLTR